MRAKARKYRHISWRETKYSSGWIVQWQGKTIGGFHDNEEDAAETLRKARGLKRKSQLDMFASQKKAEKPEQRSAFIGVCFHKGLDRFVVHDVSTGGTYLTAEEAAVARAETLGLPRPERKRIAAKVLIFRIAFMRRIYMPARGNIRLFADLSSAVKHTSKSKAMFAAEPTYEMMCIQLKYDPWRDALLSAWIMRGKPRAACSVLRPVCLTDDSLHERASNLQAVLVQAVRNMANADLAAWSSNCSRIVGRHSAPERVLQHLGILREPSSSGVQRSDLEGQDLVSALASSRDEVEASVQKLMKVIWGWSCISKLISRAPRTCHEWCELQESMLKELRALKVDIPRLPRTENSYVTAWTMRTLLFMRMRGEGIQKLIADENTTPFRFCQLCPDQNAYMYRMYYALRPKNIAEFLQKCGFKGGPPELLSCFACFSGDMAWDGLKKSRYNVKLWTKALDKYHKEHSLTAIPAVIMSEL